MKKHLIAITLGLAFSAQSFANDRTQEESNNELIGFGSGVVVGAAVAGPIGAAIAGIFGIMIADDVNDENRLDLTENELALAESKLSRQENQLLALTKQYEQAKKQNRQQLAALDKEFEKVLQETQANIQFKTASYEIESHFKPQLDLLAKGLTQNPDLVVNLSGFADRRGDDSYNKTLSEQRVLSVKSYLLDKGVSEKQVLTNAYGESNPVAQAQSFEDDFFDRRVLVKIGESEDEMTASN